jgi:hypothetical protein
MFVIRYRIYFWRVATLLDIITYEQVQYLDLASELKKVEIRRLAIKLWPLQEEINRWPSGRIDLQADGKIVLTAFSVKLSKQIRSLVKS